MSKSGEVREVKAYADLGDQGKNAVDPHQIKTYLREVRDRLGVVGDCL